HSLTDNQKIAKSDRSPVTIADFGSQATLISHLLQTFPHDPIVGEEEAAVLRQADQSDLRAQVLQLVDEVEPGLTEAHMLDAIDYGAKPCDFTQRYWTLDPIDGTKGFVRGDQYAVALALVEDGQPVLGVLGCPNLPLEADHPENEQGCLFNAVKGQGAFMRPLNGKTEHRITVSPLSEPENARFCDSVEAGHASHDDHAKIAQILGITTPSYRIDSQCKYAVVARGDASIYLRLTTKKPYRSWIWDHAAGAIIVQEAGGTVTDMHGIPLDFSLGRRLTNNAGVIATNGALHDQVIAAVGQIL
ncbi:3'(2'),5'-bisphosphate nucleotidase, partial [candidate division KSB3 bacterium]|nr:3'(2'),5'-bisphosphate nucleotidase [candidate division KSB3 bacterium]MBD3326907.1 3'(2'),5'-bisphosphate nucleotidase [candidate division KSB3 bacterium]